MTGRLKIDPREGCWSSYPTGKTSTYKLLGIWRPLLRSTARCSCYYNTIPIPHLFPVGVPSLSITFRFPSLSFFSALHPTTFVKKFPDTWPNFPLSPHNPSPKYGRVDMVASLTHSQLLQSCISICPFFFFLTQLNINIKLIAHININKLLV